MEIQEKIQSVYKTSKSYPELVRSLIGIEVLSYTVDVASGTILYRFPDGKTFIQEGGTAPRTIFEKFDEERTIKAIRDNQQGKTTYPEFMNGIVAAGVRFYEATLSGDHKRVTYIGSGGFYEEKIPV